MSHLFSVQMVLLVGRSGGGRKALENQLRRPVRSRRNTAAQPGRTPQREADGQ